LFSTRRRLVAALASLAALAGGADLAIAQPWSAAHHHDLPKMGEGADPDANPLGRPIDPDRFLEARTDYEQARIGDAYVGGHGNRRAVAIRDLHRTQARIAAQRSGRTGAAGAAGAVPPGSDTAWTPIGPDGLPNGQTTNNEVAVSGRATSIAVDPTDSDVVYVGTANGGVFRTTDGGTDWTPIFDQAQSLAIGALALAPSDPTTLYVGTGEANNSGDSYAGVGLYRIDNAKTTATIVGPINPTVSFFGSNVPAFRGASISRIIVSPTAPGTVFLTSKYGVDGVGSNYNPHRYAEGLFRSTNADAGNAGNVTMTPLQWPQVGNSLEGGVDVAATSASFSTLLVSVED
jgi:hypothetical protein